MNLSVILIVMLCLSVAIQMLGVPISFFHLDDLLDLVESSVLEGFSLASSLVSWNPLSQSSPVNVCTLPMYRFTTGSDVFHPPLAGARYTA
jgi:hypothetical protein